MKRRAFLGFFAVATSLRSGTGAAVRSMQSKEPDIINPAAFGALGDGVSDDAAAIQRALTAANGKTLEFPPGRTYVTKSEMTLPNSIAIDLKGSTLKPTGNCRTFASAAPAAAATTTVSSGGTIGSSAIVVSAAGMAVGQWYFITTSNGLFPMAVGKMTNIAGTAVTLDTPLPWTFLTPRGVTLNISTYTALHGTLTIKNGRIDGAASTLAGPNDATHSGVAIYAAGYETVNIIDMETPNFAVNNSNNTPIVATNCVNVNIIRPKLRGCVIRNAHIAVLNSLTARIMDPDISGSGFGVGVFNVADAVCRGGSVIGSRAKELAANRADTQHSIRGIKMYSCGVAKIEGNPNVADYDTNIRAQNCLYPSVTSNETFNGGIPGGASILVDGGDGIVELNKVHKSKGGGIAGGSAKGRIRYVDNEIKGCVGYGISSSGPNDEIIGGKIIDWGTPATTYGAYLTSPTGKGRIDGVTFSNSKSALPPCIKVNSPDATIGTNNIRLTANPLQRGKHRN